jgi:hypothetical protein
LRFFPIASVNHFAMPVAHKRSSRTQLPKHIRVPARPVPERTRSPIVIQQKS